MNHELKPIKPALHNKSLGGFDTKSPSVRDGKVSNLPICDDGHSFYSVWFTPNLWDRVKFLFHGKITLRVLGRKQPAVCLMINDETKILKKEAQ